MATKFASKVPDIHTKASAGNGCSLTNCPSSFGISRSFASAKVIRADENKVALIADDVASIAATTMIVKPAPPIIDWAASARANSPALSIATADSDPTATIEIKT